MQKNKKDMLDDIIDILPAHVYWYGLDGIIYGMNNQQAKSYGLKSPAEAIGSSLYDITDKAYADEWQRVNAKIVESQCITELEEVFCYPDGREGIFLSRKAPWYNEQGKAIGVIGVSMDITEQKKIAQQLEATQADLESLLEGVIATLPGHIYWQDKNDVVLGCNDEQARTVGLKSRHDMIGKTNRDMPWHEKADEVIAINQKVMATGETVTAEEPLLMQNGQVSIFLSKKAPLKNKQGEIIGTVGISFDITSQKEAERLRLENEAQRAHSEEQDKFAKISAQVAHDIKSPTTSLLMLVKSCNDIPEKERVALRQAAMRIQDIANNLIHHYQKTHVTEHEVLDVEPRVPVLMSTLLMELLAEKRYHYRNTNIKLEVDIPSKDQFVFTMMQAASLKRTISNLVNNAAEACPERQGTLHLKLVCDAEWVRVVVQDNGSGMPPALIKKIMDNITVTEGKKGGHGLGLTQARETIERNYGELSIDSVMGKGTTVTLAFPRVLPPNWIADQIVLQCNDIVMILDDDESIHGAWDSHFAHTKKHNPTLLIHHFTKGNDFLFAYENLSPSEQKQVCFLSDYELLHQDRNGLDIIEETGIPRSILVTSHYANEEVLARAVNLQVKILPKLLASEIPIIIEKPKSKASSDLNTLVLIDDDTMLLNMVRDSLVGVRDVACYESPKLFLADLDDYKKGTPICFDYDFNLKSFNGLVLAKQLFEKGYKNLYLISGMKFDPGTIPEYVTVLGKENLSRLAELTDQSSAKQSL